MKSVYTQVKLCVYASKTVCILKQNCVYTQVKLCVYSSKICVYIISKTVCIFRWSHNQEAMGWQWAGLVVGVMGGGYLQLRHCASAIVPDSNISYCQMLLSRDTVQLNGGIVIIFE
jgi:hypothetical protein